MSKRKKKMRERQPRQQPVSLQNKHPPLILRMKYDAAQTTPENARHWSMADGLSADASMTPEIRRTLRNRARYEVACNSYAKGMALSIASDCIGTGPRLQMISDDDKFSTIVETEFTAWAEAVRLGEKLQTMRMSKITDGEAFAAILKNPKINHPVEIDIRTIEADRVTSPYPSITGEVDGIEYDPFGNPVKYHVSSEHPGDSSLWYGTFETIAAEYMVHWYRPDRPGQSRGLPEIMPALPLFAQLRRYTLAVLAAAETAADFNDSINSQSTIRLFDKLEAKHPDAKVIHIIVDNATYYKSVLVKEYLETSRINIHFLPGYSPNLNLIERLWKFFKKKILYSKYYETFDEFLSACKSFFRCRTKYREELRSLLAENFHQYQTN